MCNMAEEYTDYESSPSLVTEDPDPVVVDQNGEAYERPHLAPKSKPYCERILSCIDYQLGKPS